MADDDDVHRVLPYDSLRLHVTSTHFFVEPVDTLNDELLLIDRVTQEIRLASNAGQIPLGAEQKAIHGIFGIIRLVSGPYLIVITKKVKIGMIADKSIWKVTGTEILPYQKTLLHLNEQQMQDNARYLSMVETVLATDSYFFSTAYDITHTMQRLHNTSPDFKHIPLHERADARFVWNGYLLRELAQQADLARYCIPIMLGFVSISDCVVKKQSVRYTLISRRSCFRAGTRYYVRGLDTDGHAANFVETEQVIENGDRRCSFVQTRGSVPFFWYQYPNLSYKPQPAISAGANHLNGFKAHMDSQVVNYGRQVLINLLDQKGHEEELVNMYGRLVQDSKNTNIRYEPFDFHKECRRMQWSNLDKLIERVRDDLNRFGFFMMQGESVKSTQFGVFRTNCIDCLDRTNVVQSMLAKQSLLQQFVKLDILVSGEQLENHKSFEDTFKNVWADNADACAVQYAGTGALKTDFTRTGQRTKMGALKDGWNSAFRYFLNNFSDGYRQDAIDLFLGNYVVEETEGSTKVSPLRQERDWKFYALPVIFIVAFSMCIISILIPDEHFSEQLLYVLFWGGASLITLAVIYYYGKVFVDRPKLVQAKLKME